MDLELVNASFREPGWNFGFKRHVHRNQQLFACVQGSMAITIEGERIPLRSGMAVLVPPGHGREVDRTHGPRAYIFALFETAALDLTPLYRRQLYVDSALQADFSALVQELKGLGGHDGPLLLRTLLMRLLLGFRRQVVAPVEGETAGDRQLVRRVDQVLAQNLHRQLSRADIAKALSLSEPHLARLYKAASGTTLHARLTALRIEQAKRLLDDSSLSCGQIAREIGIVSVSHFTKLFRQATGMTPTAWRASIGKR